MEMIMYLDTQFGRLGITGDQTEITRIFVADDRKEAEYEERETPLLLKAAEQLREYLAGQRRDFALPLRPQGTAFQKKVWQALTKIPYGETRSYKEIAEMADSPKGFRAVGMANNRNPIMIVIPCHRVIGADGSLVGYGGGLPMKKGLLALEGVDLRH